MLLWDRDHGRRKRVEVIADLIAHRGWQTQLTLARGVPPTESPALNEETLFVLVDDALVRAGVTTGASRAEAEEALRLLQERGTLRPAASGTGYVVRVPPAREDVPSDLPRALAEIVGEQADLSSTPMAG